MNNDSKGVFVVGVIIQSLVPAVLLLSFISVLKGDIDLFGKGNYIFLLLPLVLFGWVGLWIWAGYRMGKQYSSLWLKLAKIFVFLPLIIYVLGVVFGTISLVLFVLNT